MDAAALASLLSTSTDTLSALHTQIGHPEHALQEALESLHQALKSAVDDQIARVQQQVETLKQECTNIENDSAQIKLALGGGGGKAAPIAATSPEELESMPLLQRKKQLENDCQRMQALYATKEAHRDRLMTKLDSYRPLLGDFIKPIQSDNPELQSARFKDVSLTKIASIEAEIIRCSKQVNAQTEKLRSILNDVSRLWCDLLIEPCKPVALGDEQVFADATPPEERDCGGGTVWFDKAILAHLQVRPAYNDEGRFEGDFVSTEGEEACEEDEGDRTTKDADILESTPTRASFGGQPARSSGELMLRIPARSAAGPSHQLEPTELNIALASKKVAWLEQEKVRREALIQELYDELSELWAKFDVPEEEMDAFVMDHRGSTIQVIEAYHSELEKMKALKAQHMSLFILKTRERISALWDSLFLTEEEREASFPPYFIDVSPESDEPLPTDEILASHEQMIEYLTEQVRTKAPVLKVIGRYKELLDEARQLEESAADTTRLLGRGNRGDPGRLLREEKMRKRVKVQKPRIEAELQKVVPAWEAEHGEPFMINGVRYLDELLEQIEGSKENQTRKRTRVASVAPTPSRPPSVLHNSVQSNRMRPITPSLSAAKKPRIAPNTTSLSNKTPRMAPPSSTRSRIPSSASSMRPPATRPASAVPVHRTFSQIPTPSSPPKTTARAFTGVVKVMPRPQRESFRPRPSVAPRPPPATTASKWGDVGPPRWPGPQAHQDERLASFNSDVTTLIHKPEPAKKTRRAPSMSLETCLAQLAASQRKLGDGMQDAGICSIRSVSSSDSLVEVAEGREKVSGWQDGIRYAEGGMTTSGSNWEILAEEEVF